MNIWEKHQFKVEETGDGSPTLRWLGHSATESMHHSGGAYSESMMMYGIPTYAALRSFQKTTLHVASVGLGLGYNELLSIQMSLQFPQHSLQITSYEVNDFLKDSWLQWLRQPHSYPQSIYAKILNHFENPDLLLQAASHLLLNQQMKVLGDFKKYRGTDMMDVILYDAFSSQTSPELWSEEFLSQFLKENAAPECVFTTYACTGNLKRALKQNGFHLRIRLGFKGKRESTLAYRHLTGDRTSIDKFFHVLDDSTLRFSVKS